MTTLAALPTKDALIMGCDSLGSVSMYFVDPFDMSRFFDKDGELRKDEKGNLLPFNLSSVFDLAKSIPYNHMPHITKMYSLAPLEMGVMMTGVISIGDRTISSLMGEFTSNKKYFRPDLSNYTVKKTAERLREFICAYYDDFFRKFISKPRLEFIIGGYDKQERLPAVFRIKIGSLDQYDKEIEEEISPGNFFPVFGGQMSEIERIVKGTDFNNRIRIFLRIRELIEKYRTLLGDYLERNDIDIDLPGFDDFSKDLFPFSDDWDLDSFGAKWGDFSEQNAIDCVNFFLEIMINSQQFSNKMPTVGGPVHIAVIKKGCGFRFVSKEEYNHEGYATPK